LETQYWNRTTFTLLR